MKMREANKMLALANLDKIRERSYGVKCKWVEFHVDPMGVVCSYVMGNPPHLLHNLSVNYHHYGQVIKYVIIMKVCS